MSGSAKAGTTAERHTCELRVLITSIVRAPPKRASGESFSPLTKDLHGGPHGPETVNGCPVLRRQETSAERHTCELQVLIASIVRAPPKRASGESFSPLTTELHGGQRSGNWDLPPGCSVSTNWRLLGTVHEFESTRSQMDSITMATAIRSKKWKATASPGGENREAGAGARSGSRRLISTVCCG